MGFAALSFVFITAFGPPPFPAATTMAGTVNGSAMRMASGTSRDPVRVLLPRLVEAYGASRKSAVWIENRGHGLFWQWRAPKANEADLKEAVRVSKKLTKKLAERMMIFWGPVLFLYDIACTSGELPLADCNPVGVRELAAIAEAVAPLGSWQIVMLRESDHGETAWSWMAFENVKLSKLLPSEDPAVHRDNCRFAPYPLPRGSRCAVVAAFTGEGMTGRFVSLRSDAPPAEAKQAVARGLVASGWLEDGEEYLAPDGMRLRLAAAAGEKGTALLLVESP